MGKELSPAARKALEQQARMMAERNAEYTDTRVSRAQEVLRAEQERSEREIQKAETNRQKIREATERRRQELATLAKQEHGQFFNGNSDGSLFSWNRRTQKWNSSQNQVPDIDSFCQPCQYYQPESKYYMGRNSKCAVMNKDLQLEFVESGFCSFAKVDNQSGIMTVVGFKLPQSWHPW